MMDIIHKLALVGVYLGLLFVLGQFLWSAPSHIKPEYLYLGVGVWLMLVSILVAIGAMLMEYLMRR